ncbi:5-methyltetrahydropteroyltriglutamate-homocysteine methyltransferase [Buchnera aphidicola str. Bp (Baizongia pistaciae)]|uniref:5-methyltetrahydropteroyltriglutamate--homocysteine methyltransferase n=2 Tax=Buchnera aphidicola TaxID=9 RepID=METE_BUCBP|nr:RecName: Full=5-methyltetrahydropteroyltriglutamate--homocysteine methyltransferase; AltName: Full=Cobalamin-independent methionine synthase; AltName: Full=Methionine synthase, vitamin-B12 independent isozyme [Buchnera aphidicola str. Bp (Baizongia pistaciae)]AAO26774.1 5-methyltetrahydropteroyltriglutamate-homocysteine methyltransferase [Buchnera aphidicola str. Bp (Baizongia pistaciae)]
MINNHTLGFPRIGLFRELKVAQEKYWSRKISKEELFSVGKTLRVRHWQQQKELGINYIPVGDFSWYDHVLGTSMLLGNIPKRHKNGNDLVTLDTLFRVARGVAPTGASVSASEMTKWFNTNYHYIVPEFSIKSEFCFSWRQILDEIDEALLLGHQVKPVILGPLTYLWLGKVKGKKFDRLNLLKEILPVYKYLLSEINDRNISWVQIDEPILTLELPEKWKNAFRFAYQSLYGYNSLLLTTYFGSVQHNFSLICELPIQGVHLDLVHGKYDLVFLNSFIPEKWLISLGIINGKNIWKADLVMWFKRLQLFSKLRHSLWIGTSCSLLHVPIDLKLENKISSEVRSWFSFALQKCQELTLLRDALNNSNTVTEDIRVWSQPIHSRKKSAIVHNVDVKERLKSITSNDFKRNNVFSVRKQKQHKNLKLPILPTTTIGSFPQTADIRKARFDFKKGNINHDQYNTFISKHIQNAILKQEKLGIDVLVHGEFERNDMVEYFGEHLNGFVFTEFGWVQSYGSRCVKPPIIIGDVSRSKPISLDWIKYAQTLTSKPVKGMLTGPVTILLWSFVREDLSKKIISRQIALALRDEVLDLEQSGVKIIQIDEPALREGLPLRLSLRNEYLSWAVDSFKLSSSGVCDETQIHTHMCYCEFNDIMNAIVLLDADVITIETSRSDMELLEFFKEFKYPNDIGPGVYDIHSPNIPSIEWIMTLLRQAMHYIPVKRLWVNPDCGLKTRTWDETYYSLENMVRAAKILRKKL